ncbi:hypothetical protein BURK2_02100 [Burkholderiales bacterium]|nr:hypothetical protein BURK2_02100 [Burkholderiales bacterium]
MLELDPQTPQRLPLEGRAAHCEAIDTLLGWAERSIGVFDHNLGDTGWNTPRRVEILTQFFQRSRLARLEVFLRDASRFHASLPRLAALLRTRAHAFCVYQVGDEALGLYDPFMVVDQRHYWHRFHFEHARGEIGVLLPDPASDLDKRLAEIREVSGPALPVTVLGL